jgi:hypothetical protein
MSEATTPRGTPEDYREFVRQMEAAAKRNSARNKALRWRNVSMEKRARALCDLMDMGARIVQHTGYRKRPLNYPRLPEVQWADRPIT